jgi:hypothetical protein
MEATYFFETSVFNGLHGYIRSRYSDGLDGRQGNIFLFSTSRPGARIV